MGTSGVAVSPEAVDRVTESYGTCCSSPGFFDDFYAEFLANLGTANEKFVDADMDRQKELLREGVGFLVMYGKGGCIAASMLDRVGDTHAKKNLDIAPELYPIWINALLKSIEKHDSSYDAELRDTWKLVLGHGIERIQSHY